VSDSFDPSSFFEPTQIASGTSGAGLTDIQMQPFTYAGAPPVWAYQAPTSARSIVREKSFFYSLALGFAIALFLSFGASRTAIVAGALTPLSLWAVVVAFGFGKRGLWWSIARARWKHDVRQHAKGRQAITQRVLDRILEGGPHGHGQLGLPYVSKDEIAAGHKTGPGIGWDCSSLMQWAWGQEGVQLPRSAADQYLAQGAAYRLLVDSSARSLQPGDLMFFRDETGLVKHVGMFVKRVGGDRVEMVEANHPGGAVVLVHPTAKLAARWATRDAKPEDVLYYLGASRPGPL
jgi:hypothetical protein